MKIRLTENQYKRLLKEDDSDFLDGNVNFQNIGNKIDKFISKLYCNLVKSDRYSPNGLTTEMLITSDPFALSNFNNIFDRIRELFGYTNSETLLLTYNYVKLYDTIVSLNEEGNCDNLVGIPLEFYGKFSHYANIYHSAYVTGYSTGSGELYTTSYEDFEDKWDNGDIELTDDGDNIDYECYDLYWEEDWDNSYDSLGDQDFDVDNVSINTSVD
jgi:hypothetical protein